MADQSHQPFDRPTAPDDYDGRFGDQFDDELDIGGIVKTIVGVGVVTLLGMLAMVILQRTMVPMMQADDPVPSPIAEANQSPLPPFPRLQAEPEEELEALREVMNERLTTFGWVDEQAGVAHIPIERAIELLAETGLPGDAAQSGDTALGAEDPVSVDAGESGT